MTSRAKRLTLMVGAVALVAFVAASVMIPDTLAAPRVKTAFTITTKEKLVAFGSTGTFHAKGAIQDSGRADGYDWNPELELTGAQGTMVIDIEVPPGQPGPTREGTFTIVDATGQYEGLINVTGAYAEHLAGHGSKTNPILSSAAKNGPESSIQRTLEGSVPQ
jgi:hypothetical protein